MWKNRHKDLSDDWVRASPKKAGFIYIYFFMVPGMQRSVPLKVLTIEMAVESKNIFEILPLYIIELSEEQRALTIHCRFSAY